MQPPFRLRNPGGIKRQPLHQDLAHLRRAHRQGFKFGPRRLGVDVVGRDRRHTAPIVDARADQRLINPRRQIGRRLHVHIVRQDQTSRRDAPEFVVQIGLFGIRPLGVGLGTKILHDHFLDVTVVFVQVADGVQRVQPFRSRFANADQDAGREGHREFAGQTQSFQAGRRMFVGRTVVHATMFAQTFAGRFQHHPLADGYLPQRRNLIGGHHTGIDVRQQRGFLQHQSTHRAQIGNRRGITQSVQCFARRAIAQFRLVAQREQGFRAACRLTGPRDRQHFVRG